ncbi:rRNA maturation RNase YbeY [Pectinatus sottacetonis]|uniref:rRNA maturation RNase YbeY n=1 Tax=Pectinatus sottacetonis TaxID=1002795 RepID=UPI0018C6135B|nr:rRNA maturation RNase YbeY [Pectinatus sottacetonis]
MEILIDKIPETLAVDDDVVETINRTVKKIAKIYGLQNSEVSITLTDNKNIHELNKKYRNIDRSTDVLSFALNEAQEPELSGGPDIDILGDIVISMEKIFEQAREYGHSVEREIAFITTHGMLHLLGYDHIEEADRIKMQKEEKFIMEQLQILR